MPEFILTHRFPADFKGSPATAAAATAWFQQLGKGVVSRTDPTIETRKLGDCWPDTLPNAYTIVSADDAEAAVRMVASWPLLEHGAGLELRALTTRELDLTVRP